MKKLNLKFVSDLIGDSYREWSKGDVIKISSPTGTGKNYFLFNALTKSLKEDEKILYLCNRKALKDETKIDLYKYQDIKVPMTNGKIDYTQILNEGKIGKVVVKSYQSIGEHINKSSYDEMMGEIDLSCYKYVVCDEFHYILSDSFTGMTDLTFKRLMKSDATIKIFMSATMQMFDEAINKLAEANMGQLYEYTQPCDYSYVDVNVFDQLKNMALTIKNDTSNEKWVIFVYSSKHAQSFMEIIGHDKCTFVKSGSSEIKDIVTNKTFDKKVLLSTCVLDNGINLKDTRIKNIVIMESHYVKFIQMLGRLRFTSKTDGVYAPEIKLYMPKLSFKNFENTYNRAIEQFEMVNLYQTDLNKFNQLYDRNAYKIPKYLFYNYKGKANQLNIVGYWDLIDRLKFYEDIEHEFSKNDYALVSRRMTWLGKSIDVFNEIDEVQDDELINDLEKYLESLVGLKLFKDEQEQLINRIDHKVNRRQVKTQNGLNAGLFYINIPYTISNKKSGSKRYWIVERNSY